MYCEAKIFLLQVLRPDGLDVPGAGLDLGERATQSSSLDSTLNLEDSRAGNMLVFMLLLWWGKPGRVITWG
jgi:hypothetical protein